MLDWTTRHTRFFLRQFSPQLRLYTEMVTQGALIHGDRQRFLAFHADERPLAIQLGGSDRQSLAKCTVLAHQAGFDEVNLNVGCPSDRVQSGRFGACLMAEPALVRDCVSAMLTAANISVSVKCRLGIDREDSYEYLRNFVDVVAESGCATFIVHARNAWLEGLSPKENREIPPLRYERVYQLKQDYPELRIVINGGIRDLDSVKRHLRHVDGVMIGREAFHNPWFLAETCAQVFSHPAVDERETILKHYRDYMVEQLDAGIYLRHLIPPLMGLYHGQPGARAFRRHLSENAFRAGAGLEVLDDAMAIIC